MFCALSLDCIVDNTIGQLGVGLWFLAAVALAAAVLVVARMAGVPFSVSLGAALTAFAAMLAAGSRLRGRTEGRQEAIRKQEAQADSRLEARKQRHEEIDNLSPADLDPRFKRWVRPDDPSDGVYPNGLQEPVGGNANRKGSKPSGRRNTKANHKG